jgi:hypothetical protein
MVIVPNRIAETALLDEPAEIQQSPNQPSPFRESGMR